MSLTTEPRPEANVDEATSWADDTTHEALQVIADGITQLAGFGVAAVSVARDSYHMQVMAVAGSDEARDTLQGTFTPIPRLLEELQHAEDWGLFKFVPQELLDPAVESWGWVPDLEPLEGADAWQPMDLLVAPLYDPEGELRGTLSIDCPTDGRRPDLAHRRILNRYAEQAARALVIAVERESFAEQVRMLSAARQVVRNAARERSIGTMLEKVQPSLIEGFRALGMWIHTFDEDGHGLGAIYSADGGGTVVMPSHLVSIAERAATETWRAQRVGIVSRHAPHDARVAQVSEPEFDQIIEFLEGIGVGSLLFVPMGAGRECLGSLVLTRSLGAPDWTETETDAALEVGRDLGRAVLNARALERERELVRELKALDDYKSKLIATLSHELKSPLAAMLANIEFLQATTELEPRVSRVLGAVDRGAARLVRVVEDLLLLAKVGDPNTPLLTRPVFLRDVVEDVVHLTSLADQGRVQVSTESEEPVVAFGDPAEIDILVTNLVSNAVKYSPPGAPVAVRLSRAGAEVCIECRDSGIGISSADQDNLFNEFFRSEAADVRAQAGTGLGLTIVERIVTRHSGRIEVDSELGRGSTFRVFLPSA